MSVLTHDELARRLVKLVARWHAEGDDEATFEAAKFLIGAAASASGAEKWAADIVLGAALRAIETDPHQWSARPCQTCAAVSAIAGRPFGCDAKRAAKGGAT